MTAKLPSVVSLVDRSPRSARRRKLVAGVVLLGFFTSAVPARAAISVSGPAQQKDGKQQPAGTTYSGGMVHNPPTPPVPPPVPFHGTYEYSIEGDTPPDPQEHTFGGVVSTPALFYCNGGNVCSGSIGLYTGDSDEKTCGGSCSF